MAKPRILLTRRWPAEVQDALNERFDADFNPDDVPLSADALRKALQEYDALLPTVTDRIDANIINVDGLRTKIIANYGVGFSNIDTDAARERGITVTNTPDVLTDCTADIAMTLILMSARRIREAEQEVRTGNWAGWRPTHMIGTKVYGGTLGIIGFGRIGQAVARRARFGFDMKVLAYNTRPVPADVLSELGAQQIPSIDELLPKCDFVSLHCPGGKANRHLMDAHRLKKMRSDAYLINTARGEIVDESALAEALRDGTIRGAGLDVYEHEPKINDKLMAADNIVLLPHVGSATAPTRDAMGFRVMDNLLDFFGEETPRDKVA